MKVALLPGDSGGCGHYRVIWPGEAVAALNPDWSIETYRQGALKIGLNRHGEVTEIRGWREHPDVLVMQRAGSAILTGIAEWCQHHGIAVVADFDDAMWCIDKANTSWSAWNKPRSGLRQQHWSWCDRTAGIADLVTVTTPGLAARYGAHGRVEVLPNRVPAFALRTPERRSEEPLVVGWSGYTANHPRDCQISAPGALAAREAGATLAVMADRDGAARDWGLSPDQVTYIPSEDLGPAYYAALSRLDIMLVGLRPIPFNRCKSTLKVLEAGAAGVPSIASGTRPHLALEREGFPLLVAETPEGWRMSVKEMAASHDEWVARVRETMPRYTIEASAKVWAEAWSRAARRREGFTR